MSTMNIALSTMTEDEKKRKLKKLQRKAYKAVLCAYVFEDSSSLREIKKDVKIKNKHVEKRREKAYKALVLALTLNNPTINPNTNPLLANMKRDFHIYDSFHKVCVDRVKQHPLFVQPREETASNEFQVVGVRRDGETNKLHFKVRRK